MMISKFYHLQKSDCFLYGQILINVSVIIANIKAEHKALMQKKILKKKNYTL